MRGLFSLLCLIIIPVLVTYLLSRIDVEPRPLMIKYEYKDLRSDCPEGC